MLLAAANPGAALLNDTPVFGIGGTRDGFGVPLGPWAATSAVREWAMTYVVELARSAGTLVTIEGGTHGDVTYPVGDALGPAPVLAAVGAENRRYTAGLVNAFCRKHLRGEPGLEPFLVDGAIVVANVTARTAARPATRDRVHLEAGEPLSVLREGGGGAHLLAGRTSIIDCNLTDPVRTLWLFADRAGAFVRWHVPSGAPAAIDLSLHVAQIADEPGIISLLSTTDYAPAITALDAGQVNAALGFALFFWGGIELDGAAPDRSGACSPTASDGGRSARSPVARTP